MLLRSALLLHVQAWSASSFLQVRSGAVLHRVCLERRCPGLSAASDDEPVSSEPVAGASAGEAAVVDEALAGLSVAFSLLPKAIACASIVGVDPLVGVWSSVVMGVAAPLVGMRPGVIAGSAAVVAVPLGAFVAAHGPELVPVVVVEAAALQLAAGLRAGFTFT